jgi:hypothetical protein
MPSWYFRSIPWEHILSRLRHLPSRNFKFTWQQPLLNLPTWNLQWLTWPIHLHGLRSRDFQSVDPTHFLNRLHGLRIWDLQPIDRKQLFNRLHRLRSWHIQPFDRKVNLYRLRSWHIQHCRPIRLHDLRSWNL